MLLKPSKEAQLHVGINIQIVKDGLDIHIYPYLGMEYRAVWQSSSNPSVVSWYKSQIKLVTGNGIS